MIRTHEPFDLAAWRKRLGWTQAQAAAALRLSLSGYCAAEWRAADRADHAVSGTLVALARALEDPEAFCKAWKR